MQILRRVGRRILRTLRPGTEDVIDDQAISALEKLLRPDSNCVDVGASRGAILEHIVRLAPNGQHVAIEPLQRFADGLRLRFPRVMVHGVALADADGVSEFHDVLTNPGYSGLKRRRYDRPEEVVAVVVVPTRRLDTVLDADHRVDLIKIDVEGGELGVLQGAMRVLVEYRPVIIFEHGLGAADFYGTQPGNLYSLLTEQLGYGIFTLEGWLSHQSSLSLSEMEAEFTLSRSYMFVAIAPVRSANSTP